MYITVRGATPDDAGPGEGDPAATTPAAEGLPRRGVGRVVVTLGTVSLFTDLSSEMVVAALPVYLTLYLGLSPLQFGVIDSIYRGVTAAVRILGGMVADLTRRPKAVAVAGYGLSCVMKLALLPAQSFAAISAVIAVDRTGKGIRTAPRDVMIAQAVPQDRLGTAFGVHRAMDTIGALGGPLIAFLVLWQLPNAFDALFVLSFAVALVGVAALVLFVPDVRPAPTPPAPGALPTGRGAVRRAGRQFAGLLGRGPYRRVLAAAGLLSLVTVTDSFVYLVLQDRVELSGTVFPLLFVGTAIAYLTLAVPAGRLADRIGRGRVFLGGHVAAVLAYLALWLLPPGPWLVVVVLGLVGVYYAATDGVLPALAAPLLPEGARGTGIAGVQTAVAVGGMLSAVLFGSVWTVAGSAAAVGVFAGALALAVVGALFLLPARTAERAA